MMSTFARSEYADARRWIVRSSATMSTSNPSGKAAADLDPHVRLELRLESLRCPRNEHVFALFDEEHDCRIGVEQVADAVEQMVEKLIEVEVREGGLGDRLEPKQAAAGVRARRRPPGPTNPPPAHYPHARAPRRGSKALRGATRRRSAEDVQQRREDVRI